MRFVLWVHFISESLALGIKNAGNVVGLNLRARPTHHVDHSINGASRVSSPISEVWHGMKGAIKVT
jgi:hypothetical protein